MDAPMDINKGEKKPLTIQYSSPTQSKIVARKLNDLRESKEFCDYVLKTEDGTEISVHKIILMSSSGYFEDMLESGMSESRSSSMILPGISGHCLESLISYIYTCKINIKPEDLKDIAAHARVFRLEDLVDFCEETLSQSINNSNCFDLWNFAELRLLDKLQQKCISHILHNATLFFDDPKSLTLSIEQVTILLDSERLNCSEEKVYDFAIKWIKSNASTKPEIEEAFKKLADLIRFPIMKEDYIASIISSNEIFENNLNFWKKIGDCIKYKWLSRDTITLRLAKNLTPRIGSRDQSLVCLYDGSLINISNSTPLFPTNMKLGSTKRTSFGYTMFGTNFFLITGGQFDNTCDFFSPIANEWHKFPAMKTTRWCHSNIYLDNKIYACGGYESVLKLSQSVEVIDLNHGEWISGPQLNECRENFGLTELDGCLYAFGGATKCVERLDPRMHSWQIISDTCPFSEDTRSIASNNTINVFNKTRRCVFDPRANKFGEVVNLPVNFVGNSFDICNINNRMHILGCTSINELRCYSLNFESNSTKCVWGRIIPPLLKNASPSPAKTDILVNASSKSRSTDSGPGKSAASDFVFQPMTTFNPLESNSFTSPFQFQKDVNEEIGSIKFDLGLVAMYLK